jgi:hypothetical protein
MASAADQEIVTRALDDASRHAVKSWDNVYDYRAGWISDSWINFVNAPDGDARLTGQSGNRTIQVFHIKSAMEGIEADGTRPGHGYFTPLSSPSLSIAGDECSCVLVNYRGVMARYS